MVITSLNYWLNLELHVFTIVCMYHTVLCLCFSKEILLLFISTDTVDSTQYVTKELLSECQQE